MNKKNLVIGEKVLVTTDNWFFAPNGEQYRAVWGTVKAILDDQSTLGVKTNARSTNWYAEIGNMTIAGCQIHYAVWAPTCHTGDVAAWKDGGEGQPVIHYTRPSSIYNADA